MLEKVVFSDTKLGEYLLFLSSPTVIKKFSSNINWNPINIKFLYTISEANVSPTLPNWNSLVSLTARDTFSIFTLVNNCSIDWKWRFNRKLASGRFDITLSTAMIVYERLARRMILRHRNATGSQFNLRCSVTSLRRFTWALSACWPFTTINGVLRRDR